MRYMLFGVQVSRYLKKIEKHEAYLDSVSGLGTIIEPLRLLGFWIVFCEIYDLWCTGEPVLEEGREG
jgi:hypothetical protein